MMDPNAYTTPFQLTKTLRRDVYPAIDPSNPELSAAGKVVLITGATGGLGGEIARAWAIAGAKAIVLVGRNEAALEEPTAAIHDINASIQVLSIAIDILSEEGLVVLFKQVVDAFGSLDVVIHAAGSIAGGPIGDLEPSAWFRDYEVNVKGSYNLVYHFLKHFSTGTFIFVNSLGASFTAPGMSAYSGSKMALLKLAEYLHAEKPDLRVFSVHPGMVGVTASGRGMVVDALTPFAIDKGVQTGGLSLYLTTSRADYLRGTFVSVNWDVREMEEHKAEISEKSLLKLAFLGAKLGPDGHPWTT